ncbi:hypothetical protein QZH41_007103 [Actinostola sp. cb2023]|nr:hypothetical protein QZH41_007103 [Actinostola sp. cb2023]
MKTMSVIKLMVCLLCALFLGNEIVDARHTGFLADMDTVHASRVCKPGPAIHTTANKKCLVIGDSVSIGYTAWVRSALQDRCDVYHAPWDTSDGGALDTKYAIKCLRLFLTSNLLEQVFYDVIVFNFGLHDANFNFDSPEEYTDPKTYRENLMVIKDTLLATGSNVGYIMTTPVPFNVTANNRVKTFNMIARDVMSGSYSVEIADLYKWVVLVCGEPPYASCAIADKQPSPHYTGEGYQYLSVLVNHLVSNLLFKGSQHNIMMADHAVKASYHVLFWTKERREGGSEGGKERGREKSREGGKQRGREAEREGSREGGKQRGREAEREGSEAEREGSREGGKQRGREAEREGSREGGKQRGREAEREGSREGGKQRGREAEREGSREGGKQRGREAEREGSREGRREAEREGSREGGKQRGREAEREGSREGGKQRGREAEREGSREGGKQRGRKQRGREAEREGSREGGKQRGREAEREGS